jgi:multicomponent Na+:H+ antiporter subunit E
MDRDFSYQAAIFCILLAIWLVFSGQFDAFHVSLGILSCFVVTWMSSDFLFPNREVPMKIRWREASRLPGYVVWLLYEIVLANLHVLRLAFQPGKMEDVEPQIVRFRTTLKTEFARWVLANSITLTPGTVTVKVEDDELYVHAISVAAAKGLEGEMEARVRRIFEPEEGEA